MQGSFVRSVSRLRAAFDAGLAVVYPHRCLSCNVVVADRGGLCGACWAGTRFLAGHVCDACGAPLTGDSDGIADHCDDCIARPRPWGRGRAALAYSGSGRRLVMALKHGDRTDVAVPAARWMARAARGLGVVDLVAPVPLHRLRLLKRRYNQAALLSAGVARDLGALHVPDLLVRHRRTASTEGMTRDQRFAMLAGSIAVAPGKVTALRGAHVLVIDDVMTSGATLAACTEACLASGAREVSVLALARVTKDD